MQGQSGVRATWLRICAAALAGAGAGCLTASAQTQQQHSPQKPTITVPSLAAQGFEVKAAFGSYLVLQRGKDVWLCYMLETRSSCEPTE